MAQQNLTIEVNARQAGKHHSRGLRLKKNIPAVVYGPKTKPLNFTLPELDAVRYSKRGFENTIFTLKSTDKALDGIKVLRKAMAIHPLSRRPIHLDFYALDMSKTVRVNVELRFAGKALGIGDGGIVNTVRRDVEVEVLPTAIPDFFEVDITGLGLNESMHVSDVNIPEGVKLITSPQETIATCSIVEEIVAAPTAAAAADAAPGAAPAAGAAAPGAAPAAGAAAPAAPAKK